MPIETNNLVLYKSERLTDADDGGGKYSGQVVIDGESNNLFPDVSESDRTIGRVQMRKIFAAVTSEDTDTLMGASVFISKNPTDPNVSALLFSTDSATDVRTAAANRIESYLAKAGKATGELLETAWQGMKAIQVCMFESETEASIGTTLVLCYKEGKIDQHEQYVRVITAESRIAKMMIDGKEVTYKLATYGINDPLEIDFVGLSASEWYNGKKSDTIIRDTMVADTGKYYASVSIVDDVSVGDSTIKVSDIYRQLVPSSQTETPIQNQNASNESVVLVAANSDAITMQVQTNVSDSQNLYIGSSVMQGSVSFTLFGQAVTDDAGVLKTSTAQVGTINYQNGLITWSGSNGTGITTINLSFKPSAPLTQPFQTYAVPVTQQNQSANWTGFVVPIPAPGTLAISYVAQGKVYTVRDSGNGRLTAGNEAFGSGTISYESGAWLLTTGALADVGSVIILTWGTPITTFERTSLDVKPAQIEFDLEQTGIKASSVEVSWLLSGVTKTATSNSSGEFTGDATGSINYASGKGYLIPAKLPQKGTTFAFEYEYGLGKEQTVNSVVPDANHKLSFTIGTGSAIQPNSVELTIPVTGTFGGNGEVIVTDRPISSSIGELVGRLGNVQGTITYATGAVEIIPVLEQITYQPEYIPVQYTRAV